MSRTRFVETFTKAIKVPPSHYITLWRITSAQKLLRTSNQTTEAIADQCGYESVIAFSKVFKRSTSQTSSEFRKTHH